jgi:site-specific recombinase XerD
VLLGAGPDLGQGVGSGRGRHAQEETTGPFRLNTMAQQFLADNGNDLVGLAQVLGHENVNTTASYTRITMEQLAESVSRVNY